MRTASQLDSYVQDVADVDVAFHVPSLKIDQSLISRNTQKPISINITQIKLGAPVTRDCAG